MDAIAPQLETLRRFLARPDPNAGEGKALRLDAALGFELLPQGENAPLDLRRWYQLPCSPSDEELERVRPRFVPLARDIEGSLFVLWRRKLKDKSLSTPGQSPVVYFGADRSMSCIVPNVAHFAAVALCGNVPTDLALGPDGVAALAEGARVANAPLRNVPVFPDAEPWLREQHVVLEKLGHFIEGAQALSCELVTVFYGLAGFEPPWKWDDELEDSEG